jgi:predicted membrane protein
LQSNFKFVLIGLDGVSQRKANWTYFPSDIFIIDGMSMRQANATWQLIYSPFLGLILPTQVVFTLFPYLDF